MNERNTTAGMVAAVPSEQSDHFKRLQLAAAKLEEADLFLQHRTTHETQEARRCIREAKAALGWEDIEAPGEGEQGSEGVHGQDQEEA